MPPIESDQASQVERDPARTRFPGPAARRLWFAGLVTTIFLMLPVWAPRFIGPLVDDSWLATLHHFAYSGLQFGHDLVFTRGPLGYLQLPFFHPETYTLQILFYLLVGVALVIAARDSLPKQGQVGWGASLIALFVLVFYLRRPDAYLSVIAAAYALRRCFVVRSGITPGDVVVLLCLAVASVGKPIHLVAALAVVGYSSVAEWRHTRRVSIIPAVFLAMTGVLYLASGQHLASLPAYLGTSSEMVHGYAGTLAGGQAATAPLLALGCLGTLGFVLWADVPRRFFDRVLLAAVLGLLLGVGFKLGLLRPNRIHVSSQVLFGILLLTGLFVRGRSERPAVRRLAALAPVIALSVHLVVLLVSPRPADLVQYHSRQVRRAVYAGARFLKGRPIPPYPRLRAINAEAEEELRRLQPMARPRGEVDVLGRWQGAALAHGLDLRLRPVFQSQMAYSPRLADLNARFYRSADAPPFVLARIEAYQEFHPMAFDGPALVELLRCYAPTEEEGGFLLLARRPCEEPGRRLLLDETVELGTETEIATRVDLRSLERDRPLWLEVETSRSFVGRLAALLWFPGRLRLDVVARHGEATSYRLSPEIGRTGFLLSPTVENTEGLERLFALGGPGEGLPAVKAIYLYRAGTVPGEFVPEARVRVWALDGVGSRARTAPPG